MTQLTGLKTAALVALLTGFASAASAEAVAFSTVDSDGDGVLSMEEVKTVLPDVSDDQLVIADANADGMLDEAEYQVLTGG